MVDAFADTNVLDRNLELIGNADDHATFGGAVQFGQSQGVDLCSSCELLGLFDGILAC